MPGRPYKFKDDSGMLIEFNWDLPGEPTDEDIDRILQERENSRPMYGPELPSFELPKAVTPRWPLGGITDTPRSELGGGPMLGGDARNSTPVLGGRASYESGPGFSMPDLHDITLRPSLSPEGVDPNILEQRRRLGYGRQDEQTFDYDKFSEGVQGLSDKFTNAAADLPEPFRTPVAQWGSLASEVPRFIGGLAADPTAAATSATVMRRLGGIKPKTLPDIAPVKPVGVAVNTLENADPNYLGGMGNPELAGSVPYPPAPILGDLAPPVQATTLKPRYKLNAEGVVEPMQSAQAPLPSLVPEAAVTTPTLPRDLAGARSRYGMGPITYEPKFESDIDKALYTIGQGNKNKRHDDYMKFITDHTGMNEQEAISAAKDLRTTLKGILKGEPEGEVNIPTIFNRPKTQAGIREPPTGLPPFEQAAAASAPRRFTKQNIQEAREFVKDRLGDTLIKNDDDVLHHANVLNDVLTEHGIIPNKPTPVSTIPSSKTAKTTSGTAQVHKNGPEITKDNVEKAKQIILNYEETEGAVKILKMTDEELIQHAESLHPEAFINKNGVVVASNPAVAGHPAVATQSNTPPPKFNPETPEAAYDQLGEAEEALRMASENRKWGKMDYANWMFKEAINLPRSLWAMGDYGAALRNGKGLIGRGDYWDSLKNMFVAGWSDDGAKLVAQEIEKVPYYKEIMMRSEKYNPGIVDMASLTGTPARLAKAEEQYVGTLAKNIPSFMSMGRAIVKRDARYANLYRPDTLAKPMAISRLVRGSERANFGMLNTLRAKTMSRLITDYEAAGLDPIGNPKLLEGTANFISSLTGRGNLGTLEHSIQLINEYGFAAKFAKSRWDQAPIGFVTRLIKAEAPVRKEMLKAHTKLMSFYATAAGLSLAAGATIDFDSTSSDFLVIKFGDKIRWDALSGLQQPTVVVAKLISGLTTSPTSGETRGLGTSGFFYDVPKEYGGQTGVDVAANYLRGRSSPAAGAGYDYFGSGTDFLGRPIVEQMTRTDPENPLSFDPDNYFARMNTPNMITTIRELYNEDPESISQLGIPFSWLINGGKNIPLNSTALKTGLGALATFGETVRVNEDRPGKPFSPGRPRRGNRGGQVDTLYDRFRPYLPDRAEEAIDEYVP